MFLSGIKNKNQPRLMWLMSVTWCQSNDTVIYHRSVDTWTWAPPVANAILTLKLLIHLRAAHTTSLTFSRESIRALLNSVTWLTKQICMQNQPHPANNSNSINDLYMKSVALCNWNLLQISRKLLNAQINIKAWDQRGTSYFKCMSCYSGWHIDIICQHQDFRLKCI